MSDIDVNSLIGAITPEIYQNFKSAVAIRKWPNGAPLTSQQMETCLQAIIVYEHQNLPEHERTGYVPPKTEPCADDSHTESDETPLIWKR